MDRSGKHGKFITRGGNPAIWRHREPLCAVCSRRATLVEEVEMPTRRLLRSGVIEAKSTVERTYYCDEH